MKMLIHKKRNLLLTKLKISEEKKRINKFKKKEVIITTNKKISYFIDKSEDDEFFNTRTKCFWLRLFYIKFMYFKPLQNEYFYVYVVCSFLRIKTFDEKKNEKNKNLFF